MAITRKAVLEAMKDEGPLNSARRCAAGAFGLVGYMAALLQDNASGVLTVEDRETIATFIDVAQGHA